MGSGFSYKLKMNSTSRIMKDHGLNKNGHVTRYMRDTVDRLSNQYIPFRQGMLRRNKAYPSNHEIKYISPYAKYQYHGKLMLTKSGSSWAKLGEKKIITSKNLKYHTFGTGAKWDKLMLQRRENDLIKAVQDYIKRGN